MVVVLEPSAEIKNVQEET